MTAHPSHDDPPHDAVEDTVEVTVRVAPSAPAPSTPPSTPASTPDIPPTHTSVAPRATPPTFAAPTQAAAGPRFGTGVAALPIVYPASSRHVGEPRRTPDEVRRLVGDPPSPRVVVPRPAPPAGPSFRLRETRMRRRLVTVWAGTSVFALGGVCAIVWLLTRNG